MTVMPTRILKGDMEDDIRQLLHSLGSFQGDHISLLHRLQNLSVLDLEGVTQEVVQDLINALGDSKGTAAERLRQLEKATMTVESLQTDLNAEADVDEYYTYNADGDVAKHEKFKPGSVVTNPDNLLEETEYIYGDLSLTIEQILLGAAIGSSPQGIALRRSVKSFRNTKKQKVIVTKDYLYDANQNINAIKTRTKVDNISPSILNDTSMTWTPTLNTFKIDWVNPVTTNKYDFDHIRVRLYRETGSLFAESPELRSVATYTFTGLVPNTNYRFEIVAVDDSYNESTPVVDFFNTGGTAGGSVTPGTGTGKPAALLSASVLTQKKNSLEVGWGASTTDVNYHHAVIHVSVKPDDGFSRLLQIIEVPAGIMNIEIKDLEAGTRYKLDFYASNVDGVTSDTAITVLDKTAK